SVMGPIAKYTTNATATIQRIGCTVRPLPVAVAMTTQAMKPIPMPLAMEYVNGIATIVRNAGSATAKLVRSIALICEIISAPTITSAGAAASTGTTSYSGVKNIASRNNPPVTTFARPVRAPSAMPEADSRNTVFDDDEVRPPATAPNPSTTSAAFMLGRLPL